MRLTKAQQFCQDVKKLAEKYQLSFFVVTEGASAIVNQNCEAVNHARKSHIRWEKKHQIDPHHSWDKSL